MRNILALIMIFITIIYVGGCASPKKYNTSEDIVDDKNEVLSTSKENISLYQWDYTLRKDNSYSKVPGSIYSDLLDNSGQSYAIVSDSVNVGESTIISDQEQLVYVTDPGTVKAVPVDSFTYIPNLIFNNEDDFIDLYVDYSFLYNNLYKDGLATDKRFGIDDFSSVDTISMVDRDEYIQQHRLDLNEKQFVLSFELPFSFSLHKLKDGEASIESIDVDYRLYFGNETEAQNLKTTKLEDGFYNVDLSGLASGEYIIVSDNINSFYINKT